ncbi:MAG: hypothetical protein K6G75_00570 [Lachnospiraceae bacterium]|nr:hypothetical protein [Lachnospiraceae bacterium]
MRIKRILTVGLMILLTMLIGCQGEKESQNEIQQKTILTISKNQLIYPYSESTKSQNGITITDNGDGSITLDGKALKATNFYFISPDSENSKTNHYFSGKYLLTGAVKNKCSLILCYRKDGKNINENKSDAGEGCFFDLDSNSEKYNGITIEIYIYEGAEFEKTMVYPMLNQVYIDNLEWKPYGE